MGQAAKRNQQRQKINRQQQSATYKPEFQLPKNLDERHRRGRGALLAEGQRGKKKYPLPLSYKHAIFIYGEEQKFVSLHVV